MNINVIYKSAQYFALIFSLVSLSGCGFQLRGAYQMPSAMQKTYIATGSDDALVSALKRQFASSDITLVSERAANVAVFKILKSSKNKRVVSVDTRGRAREYTLQYEVFFSVVNSAAKLNMTNERVSIERDFLFDTQDVLGRSRGQAELYRLMQDDVVRQIMLRLQSGTTEAIPVKSVDKNVLERQQKNEPSDPGQPEAVQ